MSFKHLDAVFRVSKTKGPDRAILCALAWRAACEDRSDLKAGECFPGLGTIARDAGLSRSTVAARLPGLEATGEIEIRRRGRKRSYCRSNLYRITLPVSPGGGLARMANHPSGRPLQKVRESDSTESGSRTCDSPGGGFKPGSKNIDDNPEASGGVRVGLGKHTSGPPGKMSVPRKERPHFQGKPEPRPDSLDADYSAVDIPEISCKDDLQCIEDPIILAMAVTGDRDRQSWKGWVKMLTAARRDLGRALADSAWRVPCIDFFAEVMAGETVENRGAALTTRLKKGLN